MVSKTTITDLTIEVELPTQNECLSLVNKITSLITASDSEIVPVDTNILDTNKSIFTQKEIPIVLLSHGVYTKNEYPDYNVQKWYISFELTELEDYEISYSLMQELIQLFKYYQIPYKLAKVTFALYIPLQSDFQAIYIVKNSKEYPLEKGFVFIEDRYRQIVRKQIIQNHLKLLTTLENRIFCLDHLMIDESLYNLKFQIDNTKVATFDFTYIHSYLNTLFK